MKNRLLELYNCSNFENLLDLINKKDESVDDLVSFFEYTSHNIHEKKEKIKNPEDALNLLKDLVPPSPFDFQLIFLDAKSHPTHIQTIQLKEELKYKDIMKLAYNSKSVGVFLYFNDDVDKDSLNSIRKDLSVLSINVFDTFFYSNRSDSIVIDSLGIREYLDSEIQIDLFSPSILPSNLVVAEDIIEFSKYRMDRELKGLNIFNNTNQVYNLLKWRYQHLPKEIMGVINFDKSGEIINIIELFQGGISRAVIDPLIIGNAVLENDKVKMSAFIHNHPSGNTTPSEADISSTYNLEGMLNLLNVDLLDHYIVGKEGIKSFVKEGLLVNRIPKYNEVLTMFEDKNNSKLSQIQKLNILQTKIDNGLSKTSLKKDLER